MARRGAMRGLLGRQLVRLERGRHLVDLPGRGRDDFDAGDALVACFEIAGKVARGEADAPDPALKANLLKVWQRGSAALDAHRALSGKEPDVRAVLTATFRPDEVERKVGACAPGPVVVAALAAQ